MKIEMTYLERGYVANLHRRRAAELRNLAAQRSMSAVRQEIETEATFNDSKAQSLDDCDDSSESSKQAPIQTDPRRDLDYVDQQSTSVAGNGSGKSPGS